MSRLPTLYAWQGRQRDYAALQIFNNDGTPAVGVFANATALSATVWEGGNLQSLFSPVVAWNNGGTGWATGQFQCSFLPVPISALNPDGEYHFLLSATTSGVTIPAFEALLKVIATPGSVILNPPDLVSYDYCLGILSAGPTLTDEQIDALPGIISSASSLLREKCNERYFDLRTLTEDYEVTLDGYLRLRQEPVQIVTRVQGQPNLALTVSNSSAQTAQAYFSFVGHDGGYGATAKMATGITLAQTTNGVAAAPVTLLFATYPTITLLANAIIATGAGWRASVTSPYGGWASTELTGGFVGQGCAPGASPTGGALFNVLTDLDGCKRRPNSPMLYVGTQYTNSDAQRWGPGGDQFFDDNSITQGVVRVTYQAGFSIIPADVQNATVQLVKYMFELLKQELLLRSEKAGEYQYELAPEMVHAMPKPVWEMIGARKYHYA